MFLHRRPFCGPCVFHISVYKVRQDKGPSGFLEVDGIVGVIMHGAKCAKQGFAEQELPIAVTVEDFEGGEALQVAKADCSVPRGKGWYDGAVCHV